MTNGNIDATVPTESSSLDDAATKLASNDAVRVNGEISGTSNTISVPAATSGTGKSLSLEKVASGASLTVLDANSSGSTDNSVDNFTLSIPNNETAGFEPLDVTITMPNTTVALTGNAVQLFMVQSHPKQQIIHLSLATVWKLKRWSCKKR